MKILWITSTLIGSAARKFGSSTGGAGGWIEQNLEVLCSDKSNHLAIVCSGRIAETVKAIDENITYYVIPGGDVCTSFSANNPVAIAAIRKIINEEKPDIIHIWGTETELGLLVARESGNIPKVVYIQGVMHAIYEHYYDSIDRKEILKNTTIRDIYKHRTMPQLDKSWKKKVETENEILRLCKYIIGDNDWCEATCKGVNPDIVMYRQNLPIDEVFSLSVWKGDIDKHRLFCASQYAPFKGFPTLLKAVKIVREKYSDVRLEVPGGWATSTLVNGKHTFIDGYSKLMNKKIEEYGISDNIINIGTITRKEMAAHIADASVFVQASSIENHSSTLREAMSVGIPCVATDVGCAAEYISHGINGYLVRDAAPELLAYYILKIFDNATIGTKLGKNAKESIKVKYHNNISHTLEQIYKKVLEENG